MKRASNIFTPALRRQLRLRPQQLLQIRNGSGGPAAPMYVRRKPESKTLVEEHDLLWDDGVAPELTLDFDMQDTSRGEALFMWACGMGAFLAYGLFCAYVWAPNQKPLVGKKEYDLDEELGGMDYAKLTGSK
eukprot:augustus_masked-scaffold_33-processed-gene-2.15-mRNA-1 protein AED:0.08 eAED:0.09 QI:0/-1/0/1/-1/1/1/0/131